jgi:DNA-binding MarR family transcriptional regulator
MATDTQNGSSAKADMLDEQIVRQLLCSLDENAELSQRQLSSELGIALGSVNWYLKRCISKGLIKISQAPLKRYIYYLTPQGFDEKSRLMAQYLKWSFDFFRLGREQSSKILERYVAQGCKDIVLVGDGDLAEIFILSAMDASVNVRAILDIEPKHEKRLNVVVLKDIDALGSDPAIHFVLTDMNAPQRSWEMLRAAGIDKQKIVIPDLLSFRPLEKGIE